MFKSIVLTLIFGSISFLTFGQDTLRTYHAEDTLKVKEVILRINGKANGPVKRYDLEGRLVVIGSLKNDQRHGIFYDLDPETGDTLRQVTFQNNQREGEALSFYPDGTLRQRSNFVANQLEGELLSYFEEGTLSEKTPFKANKPEGISLRYYPNGSIESKIGYLAGKFHGIREDYDESGTLQYQGNYEQGELHGKEETFFPDGTLRSRLFFSNGVLDGPYLLHHSNGQPDRIGTYKKGAPEGELLSYYPQLQRVRKPNETGVLFQKRVQTQGGKLLSFRATLF
jgi:antitoxin component YwqK of YwqJK toxin-antitoxin module